MIPIFRQTAVMMASHRSSGNIPVHLAWATRTALPRDWRLDF